jgi:hypothetical protein
MGASGSKSHKVVKVEDNPADDLKDL